jgi:hypothetical protein
MSRYHVDKVMRELVQDEAAAAAFRADPAAYVAPRDLDPEERDALIACDYRTLYRLGAHPFLLWGYVRAAQAEHAPESRAYADALAPLGTPDFGT